MRLLILFVAAVFTVLACDCVAPPIEMAMKDADLIFRGKILDLRPGLNPPLLQGVVRDTRKVVVFQVIRVWKGEIGPTFEMPGWEETSACVGFWPSFLKVGTELLVYAKRWPRSANSPSSFFPDVFATSICSRTAPVGRTRDIEELGRGYPPRK